MFNHNSESYPFRHHPLLLRIRKQFIRKKANNWLIEIFDKNLIYCYPKTFSFSFVGYPDNIEKYQVNTENQSSNHFETPSSDEYELENEDEAIYKSTYNFFFKLLLESFKHLQINPVLIIDLRKIQLYDETILLDVISTFKNTKIKLLLFSNPDIQEELKESICSDNCELSVSLNDLRSNLKNYYSEFSNGFNLKFSGPLTLNAIEKQINNVNFYNTIQDKFIVYLDLHNVTKWGPFSINILNVFIHTICHTYGISWKIKRYPHTIKTYETLRKSRFFDVNKFFLKVDNLPQCNSEENYRRFGVYEFNEKNIKKLLQSFESFLEKVRAMFPNYLSKETSYRDEHDKKIRVGQSAKLNWTYYNFIARTVYELCENIRHSNGVGYLSVAVSNYYLYIFIGDCGIGLQKGILNNYKLEDKLINEEETIRHSFGLKKFITSRKEKHKFNIGFAGHGLGETLKYIFKCKGKFIFRTGKTVGSFVNPVQGVTSPSKIFESNCYIDGTQYMLIVPLSLLAANELPKTTDDFLNLEE